MAYFKVCPYCGSNLDPGEKCDCREERERKMKEMKYLIKQNKNTNQLYFEGGEQCEKTAYC